MSIFAIAIFLLILTLAELTEVAKKGHSDLMDSNGGPGRCIALTLISLLCVIFCGFIAMTLKLIK